MWASQNYCHFPFIIKMTRNDRILCAEMHRKFSKTWEFLFIFHLLYCDGFPYEETLTEVTQHLQDCPDGSDEASEACQSVAGQERRVRGKEVGRVREEKGGPEVERSGDPCSEWPPVCGQVCVSAVPSHRH